MPKKEKKGKEAVGLFWHVCQTVWYEGCLKFSSSLCYYPLASSYDTRRKKRSESIGILNLYQNKLKKVLAQKKRLTEK